MSARGVATNISKEIQQTRNLLEKQSQNLQEALIKAFKEIDGVDDAHVDIFEDGRIQLDITTDINLTIPISQVVNYDEIIKKDDDFKELVISYHEDNMENYATQSQDYTDEVKEDYDYDSRRWLEDTNPTKVLELLELAEYNALEMYKNEGLLREEYDETVLDAIQKSMRKAGIQRFKPIEFQTTENNKEFLVSNINTNSFYSNDIETVSRELKRTLKVFGGKL